MLIVILIFSAVCYLIGLPCWLYFKNRVHWYRHDYGVPFYGPLVWLGLIAAGVGSQSMTNSIELIFVYFATILMPWARVFFPGKNEEGSKISSYVTIAIPIVLAILLRLFMPNLPE